MSKDKIQTLYLENYCDKLPDAIVASQLENKFEAFEKRLQDIKDKEKE